MKKLLLLATVLGVVSLSSCKSEEQKVQDKIGATTDKIAETTSAGVASTQSTALDNATMVLPTFTSSEATAFAQKFSDYVTQLKVVAAKGDQSQLSSLTAQSVDLKKELLGLSQTLSADDAKKLNDFVAELQKSVQ